MYFSRYIWPLVAVLGFPLTVTCFAADAAVAEVVPGAGIAEFLKTYGGWGVAAITMVALARLYSMTSATFEKRHEEYVNLNTEAVKVMQALSLSQTNMAQVLSQVKEVMEQNKEILVTTKELLSHVRDVLLNCERANPPRPR